MIEHLERMFNYDYWANCEVVRALRNAPESPEALRLLSHILAAEILWFARIKGQPSPLAVWPDCTLSECEGMLLEIRADWQEYFSRLKPDKLDNILSYTNSKGESWESSLRDVLLHLINHGTHHRGQILALLRAMDIVPPPLDLIHALRQGFVK
jgi:uncharacterized damage-inducible protein DinB